MGRRLERERRDQHDRNLPFGRAQSSVAGTRNAKGYVRKTGTGGGPVALETSERNGMYIGVGTVVVILLLLIFLRVFGVI